MKLKENSISQAFIDKLEWSCPLFLRRTFKSANERRIKMILIGNGIMFQAG